MGKMIGHRVASGGVKAVAEDFCPISSFTWCLLHPQICFLFHPTDVQGELLMSRESRSSSLWKRKHPPHVGAV